MITSISGKLLRKEGGFLVVDVSGFGIKVHISKNLAPENGGLPSIGRDIFLHTAFFVKKDGMDLYGFLDEKDLEIFSLLNSVSSIGPKTALGILDAIDSGQLIAAIAQNKADIIVENSGIGRKKAEKIILELRDKIKPENIPAASNFFDQDKDVKAALKGLGYKAKDIEKAAHQIPDNLKSSGERLKAALKLLRDTQS